MSRFTLSVLFVSALLPAAADAACQWTFVNGQQRQVCDNSFDPPTIRAPAIAPIMPPSVAPIQQPMVPPVGTSSCRQAQVWNGSSYQWRTLCN